MAVVIRVQHHLLDRVLRDPFESKMYLPNDLVQGAGLSFSTLGLLLELLAVDGEWGLDEARAAERERRANGVPAEDIDALLAELTAAGFITVA